MKLSKKKGIENGTKYYSMAGTVTSDAVCAQKVYARGCSAAGNDRWRGSSPPVRSRPGHEITSHECLETALPPGVTEVAYQASSAVSYAHEREREREKGLHPICSSLQGTHATVSYATLKRIHYPARYTDGAQGKTEAQHKAAAAGSGGSGCCHHSPTPIKIALLC